MRAGHCTVFILAFGLASSPAIGTAQETPPEGGMHATTVQPGAPGSQSRVLSPSDQEGPSGSTHTESDVRFVREMIRHHSQALTMSALALERAGGDDVRTLAWRIERSQGDEIAVMTRWLDMRGETPPDLQADHADAADHAAAAHHPVEPDHGMLSVDQMRELASLDGEDFDRLFLQRMLQHHEGALEMVAALLATPGGGQEVEVHAIASEIDSDQRIEIARIRSMLRNADPGPDSVTNPDPRVGLEAGWKDAESASWNLQLVASLTRPDGFRNPEHPGDGRFWNTDMGFRDDLAFVGNYHGFNVYDISDPRTPTLRVSVICPGGQGDISVFGNLVFVSVQEPRARIDCGTQGTGEVVDMERFRGVRIFDVSDLDAPVQVAAVQTCRGSHTHTLVTDPNDSETLYVYNSGTSMARPAEELEGCSDVFDPNDPTTSYWSIDVIRVPLDTPEAAELIDSPRVFADEEADDIAALWPGGDHGEGTQVSRDTNQCHDITAYPEIGWAAGACSGNGILFDISDPAVPIRVDEVVDPNFAYWHSATFNNDGTAVIFTDEWGGGVAPRCLATDRPEWGANAIFDLTSGRMRFASYYKLPAPQSETENCVAHNGSLVPVPGRDIKVQAWYQGGVSVFDFTDSANPVEIAFFDRGPLSDEELFTGGYWSAYWYNGYLYGSEIARGLDVFELTPSEHLSENELEAARLVRLDEFNPQHQPRFVWPPDIVIIRARLDQLVRSEGVTEDRATAVATELDRIDSLTDGEDKRAALAELATGLWDDARRAESGDLAGDAHRIRELAGSVLDLATLQR